MGEQRRWSGRGAAVVLAAAVLVGACSSSNDATTAGEPPGTGASTGDVTTGSVGRGGPDGTAAPAASGPLERYADYRSISYDDPAHWVCRPDADDICQTDLDTTVIAADGSMTVEPFEPAADPPIDCFYVYPTISRDTTPFSDWNASDAEEGYVTLNQAARLRSQCRVFAPVYRQATLTSLISRMSGGEAPTGGEVVSPYDDVLDAFRTYMAQDNGGRGVVLIGHSQGSGLLTKLIAEEIDPNADVRDKLVAAYIAGSSVAVPEGEAVGGSFQNVPVCTAEAQVGCVVSWASFRSTAPPTEGAIFGKPRNAEGVAVCANPAALGGGSAELHSYFPAARNRSIVDPSGNEAQGSGWLETGSAEVTTPFVSVPGLVTGECQLIDGYHVLSITVHPDPGPRVDDITGDLSGGWGLHLVDVNLVMGDVVSLVGSQAAAYAGS
jgi:hypothetical protein